VKLASTSPAVSPQTALWQSLREVGRALQALATSALGEGHVEPLGSFVSYNRLSGGELAGKVF